MHFHELSINGVECIRKYRFEAAHGYPIHGHNYGLYILLQGQPDVQSSMVIELSQIDDIVKKEIIDKFDHRHLFYFQQPHTHEYFTQECSNILKRKIPHYHGIILVEEDDRIYAKVLKEENNMIYKTHIFKFSAAHRLLNLELTKEKNEKFFGKCQRLHGHNYTLSVTLSGEINDETGFLIDPNVFDAVVKSVYSRYDYTELNQTEQFQKLIPTTENFIKVLWNEIKMELKNVCHPEQIERNLRLDSIVLQETDRNIFMYKGEC